MSLKKFSHKISQNNKFKLNNKSHKINKQNKILIKIIKFNQFNNNLNQFNNVYSEQKKLNPCKPHFYNNIYYNFHPDQYNI